MKFNLVFENSGDVIPFEVIMNHELFEYFVHMSQQHASNKFSNSKQLSNIVDQRLRDIHWAISKTNEILYTLSNKNFVEHTDLLQYLNQTFLNQTHAEWVFSQDVIVDVTALITSSDAKKSQLGYALHEKLPDNQLKIKLAHAMTLLGYIHPYEEVNMGVHRLENSFVKHNLEFSADKKWQVFDNPFLESMISNNDVVNFSFGYTYVGRQYYNKFEYFDLDLAFKDHYNYETLEYSFQLNMSKPQTIPYSKEFLEWATVRGVKPITTQVPIANCVDIDKNLFEYRKILYRNSKLNNQVSIILH
jgi:hypothetical protein